MSDEQLPRRERERARHRREILDAALELFSESGFHNVSMQQVSEKAEFAIGTLYKFFNSKEDLYRTLIHGLADEFHSSLTSALSSGDDEVERLRNYVIAKGEVFCDNLAVVRLYFSETSGASFSVKAGLDDEVRSRYTQLTGRLAEVFEDGIQKKRLNKIADPHYLAVALESLTNAVLLGYLEDPVNRSYPQDPDVLLNVLFKGLLES